MILRPCVTGVVLKWNTMVLFPFTKVTASAGVQFTVRAFAWTLAGSAGSLKLTTKSVGGVPVTRLPHAGSGLIT